MKSYSKESGNTIYYKLSDFDPINGITGHECINEIIADRLLTILGIEHLSYDLIHAQINVDEKEYVTWLCSSVNFRKPGEKKAAFDSFFESNHLKNETPLQFCERMGWADEIYKMLVVDFLILNRDRHGANVEVLLDAYRHTIRLSPLFDHGLSLLFSCKDEKSLEQYNILEDKPVQCFVGSRSAMQNLNLIPEGSFPNMNPLKESDREFIMEGLDEAIDERWLEKIWQMIWARWNTYENFRNQKLR